MPGPKKRISLCLNCLARKTGYPAWELQLSELQDNTCFYCLKTLRISDVDHFIPWSRYPHDLGHNFVLACKPCNHSKRGMLADRPHRERWERRNKDHGSEMTVWYESRRLPHDLAGTNTVAEWAYAQATMAGSRLWIARLKFPRRIASFPR